MSASWFLFGSSAFFLLLVIGVGIYLSRRGVFKKTEQAAAQAVATDVQNAVSKVAPTDTAK